jgi:diguanylate cyclase (GGDEF)-like protein
MLALQSFLRSWPACVVMVVCTLLQPCRAATTPIGDPSAYLAQTESLRIKDHPQFVRMLAEIQREAARLSPAEQWRLRYLQAWETMFSGDYVKSQALLRDVVDHSGDTTLVAKASSLLLSNLGLSRKYEEAFALANRLTSSLPQISDPQARSMVLMNLSQMLTLAGQTDLAVQYADMLESAGLSGEGPCLGLSLRVAALNDSKRLTSSSADLLRAIDTCVAVHQPVISNTMRLVLIDRLLDEDQPAKALALLDRLAPSIKANHYYPHMLSTQVQRAKAYEQLGRDDEARKAALVAVSMGNRDELSEWMRDAYGVLYRIEKKLGSTTAALAYYEHYVTQDKGYLTDITARGLAFELSQQHMVVQKLETERLAKQNSILRLQKALETQAVQTSRLYIVLLSTFLASFIFWMFRLKRSQLRFQKLSWHDGLTGIFNRQHFMSEADRVLRPLEKRLGRACLVFIDLDHFKQVNDNHGHAMGDVVLRRAVSVCQQQLRPRDLFGRLGGEEFGVLLLDCPRAQGMVIADRIRMAIEASPAVEDGFAVSFSASAGLASTDTSGYELQRLCRDADVALYRAKRAGRNRGVGNSGEGLAVS